MNKYDLYEHTKKEIMGFYIDLISEPIIKMEQLYPLKLKLESYLRGLQKEMGVRAEVEPPFQAIREESDRLASSCPVLVVNR